MGQTRQLNQICTVCNRAIGAHNMADGPAYPQSPQAHVPQGICAECRQHHFPIRVAGTHATSAGMTWAGKIVAIDFDATLCEYTTWTGVQPTGQPITGAVAFVRWLLQQHALPVVYSCRAAAPGGKKAISDWLAHHGFPPLIVTAEKVRAVGYVDDRAVPFAGDWDEVKSSLRKLLDS